MSCFVKEECRVREKRLIIISEKEGQGPKSKVDGLDGITKLFTLNMEGIKGIVNA